MKNTVSLILFSCLFLSGFAQSNIRINNYWENTFYINPASVSSRYQFMASGAARKQWIGFPGAPNTEYISFAGQTYTRKNAQIVQLGIQVYHDNIGYTNLIDIAPSASKTARISNSVLFNFGMRFNIQHFSYDMSRARFEIFDDDPLKNKFESKWMDLNADVGIEFVGTNWLIGAVGQNLVTLFSKDEYMQSNANFIYLMVKTENDGSFNWLFGACAINNENLYQGEFKVSGIYSLNRDTNIELGGFFRTKKEFGVLFGIDLTEELRLACSYDYNVGDVSYSSFGTPEIMLVWNFKEIPAHRRIIKCNDCSELFK